MLLLNMAKLINLCCEPIPFLLFIFLVFESKGNLSVSFLDFKANMFAFLFDLFDELLAFAALCGYQL
jgi:hypothetical protein